MFGLLQKIGYGIENAGLAVEGAILNAGCAVKNAGVEIKTDAAVRKHRKAVLASKSTNGRLCTYVNYDESDIDEMDAEDKEEVIADFISNITEGKDYLSDMKDSLSVENIANIKALLKDATPEQIKEIETVLSILDEAGKMLFTLRAEIASSIAHKTPILQQSAQPQSTPLQQQIMMGNGVGGLDLAQQFQTPAGINNPIPNQA